MNFLGRFQIHIVPRYPRRYLIDFIQYQLDKFGAKYGTKILLMYIFLLLVPLMLLVGVALETGLIWSWLDRVNESNSATFRNVVLAIAGILALAVALWRSYVAQRHAVTAERGLTNERYQRGAEMLGSDVLAVRLGGIFTLRRLAEDDWRGYHVLVVQLLCAAIRTRPKIKEFDEVASGPPEDIQAVIDVIRSRKMRHRELEWDSQFFINLRSTDLRGVHLSQVYLVKADLAGADLTDANLRAANLSHVDFSRASLVQADLSLANLDGASFYEADVSGTDFTESENLTQAQLDQAHAESDNQPKLDGLKDPETSEYLYWRRKADDGGE